MAPGASLRTLLKTVMVAHSVVSPERSKYIQAEQFSLGSHLLPRRCSSHLQHSDVFVTCCISPLKYLLTSVRNVLTSTTSSRWGHSLLSCVRRRWRKFLMKVTEATVFSARVPWGLCIVPETLNLALAFWSICIRVFPLSQCVARLLREMATRHDLEYQNEYGRHDKCLPLLWHTLSKPISW